MTPNVPKISSVRISIASLVVRSLCCIALWLVCIVVNGHKETGLPTPAFPVGNNFLYDGNGLGRSAEPATCMDGPWPVGPWPSPHSQLR